MRHGMGRRWLGAAILAGLVALLALGCEDDPTHVGSDLRSPPDTVMAIDLLVVEDSVFSLPVSLRSSITGQIGAQGPYTSQILYDFRVPSFVVDEGDTLSLDDGNFRIDLTQVTQAPFTGAMRLGMREVEIAARIWSSDAVYDNTVLTRLPQLRPDVVAGEDTIAGTDLTLSEPRIVVEFDVHSLVDYDSVVASRQTLEVNVALLFLGFTSGGPGFVDFQQITALNAPLPRFVANYVGATTTGVERSLAPARQLVVVEFDSTYSPGTNWVVSDAHRFHTYVEFRDLDQLRAQLPEAAYMLRADLLLVQAARGDTVFGTGRNLGIGISVPSSAVDDDSNLVYSVDENNRALQPESVTALTPSAGSLVTISITTELALQQEGKKNRGLILRLSDEGTRARHFEFYGPAAADTTLRPHLRLVFGMPADFGEEAP
ncbi:MAG TPA: hypothetical protein VFD07_01065 [Candidatus Krumholzibacteria bacterium]|nr:hypothetical protein [Candidatus Krumholzibacteria bacterium]